MMRPIDAKKLYEQTAELEAEALAQVKRLDPKEEYERWLRWTIALTERTAFKHDVAEAPIVDAVPVKHGRWVKNEEGDYHCSECKAIVESDEKYRHYWIYCYHCGARMETEEMME